MAVPVVLLATVGVEVSRRSPLWTPAASPCHVSSQSGTASPRTAPRGRVHCPDRAGKRYPVTPEQVVRPPRSRRRARRACRAVTSRSNPACAVTCGHPTDSSALSAAVAGILGIELLRDEGREPCPDGAGYGEKAGIRDAVRRARAGRCLQRRSSDSCIDIVSSVSARPAPLKSFSCCGRGVTGHSGRTVRQR